MTDPIPRLRRLLTLIPLIRRSPGITIDELAKLLKVSRKEVNADLVRLNICGVPPYLPHDYITVLYDGDRISIDYAEHFEKPAALTLREALALKLALEALPPGDAKINSARDELMGAVDRLLREQGTEISSELEGRLASTTSDATGKKLTTLREAVKKRRPLDVVYYSASSEATAPRRLRPLGVAEADGNHYLVAHDEGKNDVRHFRVDRIHSITEPKSAPAFEPPRDFDLGSFMKKGFGPRSGQPIKLRFDKAVARFAKEDYDGFPIEQLPSGEIVVEIQAGSITWAVSRALQFGEHAEILSPPEARDELKRRLESFLSKK
ncbi:MAG: helix-turn-helix transcriptional regulator [Planctomycetota bacterium]